MAKNKNPEKKMDKEKDKKKDIETDTDIKADSPVTEEGEQPAPDEGQEAAGEGAQTVCITLEEMEEVKKLYQTAAEQKKKLDENQDQYLRLRADFDNFRKRSTKEKEAVYTDVKIETILALLPVYDNLERALKHSCSDEAFRKGVEMTMTQFEEILKKLGVEETEALGQPFDPNLHNGVMHEENEEFGENTVSEVLQKGFKLKDRIIRFAMVKVAN